MPDSPDLRAVAFDLDGLMFNTEDLYQEVGTEILRRRGKPCPVELLDAMMGRPGRVALQIMIDWHGLSDTIEQLQQETDEVFEGLLSERLAPMPGLLSLLDRLEQNDVPKAIATSSRLAFTQRVLGQFDLEPRFEFLLTAADVTSGKPHPEIYLTAAERLSISPANLLVLEDSQHGTRAGVDAGAFVVSVPGGRSRTHDFSGAAIVADSLEDERIMAALRI